MSNMQFIANDICRCHDAKCPEREQCLRLVYRECKAERTPHCDSLRPLDQSECKSKISTEEIKEAIK